MANNKWEVKSHSYAIADTGDYDGHYELTNGDITLITRDDSDETERQLQVAAAALNRWGINFFDQKVTDLEIDIHCMKDAQKWKDEEYAALRAKADRMEQALRELCELKKIKGQGKTEEYAIRQPQAWVNAFAALEALKEGENNPEDWKTLTTEEVDPELLQVMQQASQNKEANWQALKERMDKLKEGEKEPVPQQVENSDHLTREGLEVELWDMLPDDCRKVLEPLKKSYIESLMADIDSYCEGQRQPQQGPVWVKAITRLPEKYIEVIVRNLNTRRVKKLGNLGHNRGWDVGMDREFMWDNTEWLDESGKEVFNG